MEWVNIDINKYMYDYIEDNIGVYIFYADHYVYGIYRPEYIYIGKAKSQTIKDRVYQHLNNPSNEILALYLNNEHMEAKLMYSIFDYEMIDLTEKYLINRLNPIANKIKYKGVKI